MDMKDLEFNGTVGLEGDPEFYGIVVGRMAPEPGKATHRILINIQEPGETGLKGIKPFPLPQLVKLEEVKHAKRRIA